MKIIKQYKLKSLKSQFVVIYKVYNANKCKVKSLKNTINIELRYIDY